MNSFKISCATFVALFLVISIGTAQEESVELAENEKVILYNSQPVKVQLEGDKIKSFVGVVPEGYMAGFELVEKKVLPVTPLVPSAAPVVKEELVNANYSILLNKKIHLNFKPGYATLDRAMINKLNEIATELKSDKSKSLLLTTHFDEEKATSVMLAENRLKAAIAYLDIKGIPESRIRTERQTVNGLSDLVAVNFLQ